MEDKRLAARAANGDQEAFTSLIKQYRSLIYSIAYKISLHEEDALDITQNVFLKLSLKIGQYNQTGSFRSWLTTITTREAIDYLRKPVRRENPSENIEVICEKTQNLKEMNPRDTYEIKQNHRMVEKAMKILAPQQRSIFLLRLKEDMGPKEISEKLGISAQQVRSQYHRALETVKGIIKSKYEIS